MVVTPFVGIDVSKDSFDVDTQPACFTASFTNDAAGIEELVTLMGQCHPQLIVLESTGHYHEALVVALSDAGLPVFVANPRWVRHFAQGRGLLAKTDRIDAATLALYAEKVRPEVRPLPDAEQRRLQALVRRRDELKTMITTEKTRRHGASPQVQADIDAHLQFLRQRLAVLDEQIHELIACDPRRAEDYDLLFSTKGVGAITSFTLVALLPELGHLGHKQIAALVGVAPINCDSGKHQGTRRCWGGRAQVRTALYMAAVSAVQHNPQIKAFYERLLEQHKPTKLALLACAHKLLTILNAMLRDRSPWRPELAPAA
jgi:transposase